VRATAGAAPGGGLSRPAYRLATYEAPTHITRRIDTRMPAWPAPWTALSQLADVTPPEPGFTDEVGTIGS
jgi:hypothetical protein